MKARRIIKWLVIIFVAVNMYSLIPVALLYLKRTPEKIMTNEMVREKLKAEKSPYFAFIVISDTASGMFFTESATLKMVSGINREDRFKKIPIDFVINIGDITFRGRPSHYDNYLKIKSMLKYPVIDVKGNHDDDFEKEAGSCAIFNKYCGREEFSFVDRNSYFIVLDDSNGNFTDDQFTWFESELKKAKHYAHTFVFMHKPPFNPYQQSWYRVETNPWHYRFLKLCEEYGVSIVFSGHENVSRAAEFGGVKYIVCGGGGTLLIQPSWEGGFLNYIFVKVNRDYVDYEIRKIQPPLWQFFFYYMWKDLAYFVQGMLN